MKKFIIGITTGVLLSLTTGAIAASPTVQAFLFPSTVSVHKGGMISKISSNNPVLNYDNNAYIPLRSFAEGMGADVKFSPGTPGTNALHQIDIYVKSEPWRLTYVMAPGKLPDSPLSLNLNKVERENTNQVGISAVLFNKSNEMIYLSTPTKIELKIERIVEGQSPSTVWTADIPVADTAVSPSTGEYIPGSVSSVIWGLTSPALYWNKTDMNGNPVPAGQYQVSLKQPLTISYNLGTSGNHMNESQTIESDLSNKTVIYVQ